MKEKEIRVRLDEEDSSKLDELSAMTGKDKSKVIRWLISFAYKCKEQLKEEMK